MTSSTRVRGVTRWSSPRTSIVTSTSFHACTKDAAVAWRKRSCETIRACESKGCRYSPICSQTQETYSRLFGTRLLTTSLATRSQKDRTTRAGGGNTLTADCASILKVSSTCDMKASIGVKSSCRTVAPFGP